MNLAAGGKTALDLGVINGLDLKKLGDLRGVGSKLPVISEFDQANAFVRAALYLE